MNPTATLVSGNWLDATRLKLRDMRMRTSPFVLDRLCESLATLAWREAPLLILVGRTIQSAITGTDRHRGPRRLSSAADRMAARSPHAVARSRQPLGNRTRAARRTRRGRIRGQRGQCGVHFAVSKAIRDPRHRRRNCFCRRRLRAFVPQPFGRKRRLVAARVRWRARALRDFRGRRCRRLSIIALSRGDRSRGRVTSLQPFTP
jgi:hypothetical protein